jgi:chromate transport protein ChrA
MGPAPNNITGAVIALVAIFLPGLMLVYGMLPFWDTLRARQSAQAAMRGANAAVVGILGAALYSPVWTSAVLTPRDFALALAGFLLLTVWKAPPWIVVVLLSAAGALLGAVRNFCRPCRNCIRALFFGNSPRARVCLAHFRWKTRLSRRQRRPDRPGRPILGSSDAF